MKRTLLILSVAALLTACSGGRRAETIAIIPVPVHMTTGEECFTLDKSTVVTYPKGDSILARAGEVMAETLGAAVGTTLELTSVASSEAIRLERPADTTGWHAEGYTLEVTPDAVTVRANDYNGAFYALQTILQLLPTEVYSGRDNGAGAYEIPAVTVEDYPRFGWRGMHLDVSRHFFPVEFVKRYIDLLAMHKFNRFHWHLTDDQGWRLEIKKYPLLTEKSAWRVDREADGWDTNRPPMPGEKATYGGFYTQDEVRDVVKYAEARGVTVIPEIEMPGHSSEVFAAYPSLSCLGKEQFVTPGGYFPDDLATCFCAGNDSSFLFLQGVIDEVVELFPNAPYIHVGGDEVDMKFWSQCPKCQKRMKELGLKDTHELQSYFMRRMEEYINSKGKRIIGWDEILQGGLAPNATVMSWRGETGGIRAAQMGHDVVMTPDSYLYFDFYQNDPQVEPRAAGGLSTTQHVYSYEPVPAALSAEEARHILGAQANVWCEHIPDGKHVEYMVLPRMAALSEVVWSPRESRDYEDFATRLETQNDRYRAMGANFHPGADRIVVSTVYDSVEGVFYMTLTTDLFRGEVHYTLDGSEPTMESPVYRETIRIDSTMTVRAIAGKDGRRFSKAVTEQRIGWHKAAGKRVIYHTKLGSAYKGTSITLVDGLTGSLDARSGRYQGCNGQDFDVVIDLGEKTKFSEVTGSFLQAASSWIYLPEAVTVSLSDDGTNFTEVGRVERPEEMREVAEVRCPFTVRGDFEARYVRVVGVNGVTPSGMKGAGQKNWLFMDEVFVQ